MRRKSVSFGQLLDYINAPLPESLGPPLIHNLLAAPDHLLGIESEFVENAALLRRRKNGNVLFHEVLSFGARDRERVTPQMIETLVRKYLELRAPYALAYARAHFDTACPHVHLVVSANELGESKRMRMTKQRFREVKRELERSQRERFPELERSEVGRSGGKVNALCLLGKGESSR